MNLIRKLSYCYLKNLLLRLNLLNLLLILFALMDYLKICFLYFLDVGAERAEHQLKVLIAAFEIFDSADLAFAPRA